jgi:hypothetical protein
MLRLAITFPWTIEIKFAATALLDLARGGGLAFGSVLMFHVLSTL